MISKPPKQVTFIFTWSQIAILTFYYYYLFLSINLYFIPAMLVFSIWELTPWIDSNEPKFIWLNSRRTRPNVACLPEARKSKSPVWFNDSPKSNSILIGCCGGFHTISSLMVEIEGANIDEESSNVNLDTADAIAVSLMMNSDSTGRIGVILKCRAIECFNSSVIWGLKKGQLTVIDRPPIRTADTLSTSVIFLDKGCWVGSVLGFV